MEYNQRAAKGQAYNLAIHESIAEGRQNDTAFVGKRFLYYMSDAAMYQNMTPDQIANALECEDFLKAHKAALELLNG